MEIDLKKLTIAEARSSLDAKKFSALDLTNAYLREIEKRNTELNAYIEVWADSAREEAKRADTLIAEKKSQPLTGIPFGIKDNILVEGRSVTAASAMLRNYKASYSSTVVKNLLAQGAVLLGRLNMDEFALGSSTEFSVYGPTKNPHDISRAPGGTSGGSAAAMAADLALFTLGSDTGGSIRQPASLCGVIGLKTTYGAVSRYGLIAAASSLDQIGSFNKTADDARTVFAALQGADENDSTTLRGEVPQFKKPKVIGVPRSFVASASEEVVKRFDATLEGLKAKGYEIRDIELPLLPYSLPVYYVINPAEVSTNLARFDGIRYGLSEPAADIKDVYFKTRAKGFGPEVRRRILIGAFVLSSGYADAYYRKARAVREQITQDFIRAFKGVDVIATPTATGPAFKFGEKSDPLSMYLEDLFTVPVNLAGLPAISIPMGTVEREGKQLPLGLQFIAPHRAEEVLFSVCESLEQ